MTLADDLRTALAAPGILPDDPSSPILGTDLLEKIRSKVPGYADASIRQTFSYLSADATSPIARVDQGWGYYRRQPPKPEPAETTGAVASAPKDAGSRNDQPEEKFRALYQRYVRLNNGFPIHVEHTKGTHLPAGVNKWKFPDVVVLTWKVGEERENGFALNKDLLEVKRSLGEQPFQLASIELKVSLSLSDFREKFFQCVSNSKWAHSAQLVVATPIADSLLAAELRRLGSSYGVTIQFFGLSRETLDQLPSADKILKLPDDKIEEITQSVAPTSLVAAPDRSDLDWDHIRDMRAQSDDFNALFRWTARCLHDAKAYSYEAYAQLLKIEGEA